jgi:phospholipid/cholesterol/gamma-HCH transport system substrate-binding protein
MHASRTSELIAGIFALIGIAALAYLSFRLASVELFPPPGYTIYANFDDVSGLKPGDPVEIAGVPVEKVTAISLHNSRAQVSMRLNDGVQVDSDAIAAIKTSGLIGDKYVSIALGAGEKVLKDGDALRQTQSSFVLEDAIGQLINNLGSSGSKASSSPTDSPSSINCNGQKKKNSACSGTAR